LVDIALYLATYHDTSYIVQDFILAMGDGPTSPDLLLASILSFIRVVERTSTDGMGKIKSFLHSEHFVPHLRGTIALEYGSLVQSRREIMKSIEGRMIVVTNFVLRLGRFVQMICTNLELMDNMMQTLAAQGKV
jgi:hypothetical protein